MLSKTAVEEYSEKQFIKSKYITAFILIVYNKHLWLKSKSYYGSIDFRVHLDNCSDILTGLLTFLTMKQVDKCVYTPLNAITFEKEL